MPTLPQIREELDMLGVEYPENASKFFLLRLLMDTRKQNRNRGRELYFVDPNAQRPNQAV